MKEKLNQPDLATLVAGAYDPGEIATAYRMICEEVATNRNYIKAIGYLDILSKHCIARMEQQSNEQAYKIFLERFLADESNWAVAAGQKAKLA